MKRSSTVANQRGVPAQHEHRRQDGWTCTPRGSDDEKKGSERDMLAGERLPKQRPHGDEHPEHNPEEHLAHKFRIRMRRHVLSKKCARPHLQQQKRVKNSWDKDDEILRLIEERRSTPKEEKQRLKDLSKRLKNASQKKRMKRQQDIQRILEEFKGVRNIPGTKTAKKKVLITKIKNDKGECITSRKGIADVFGEFYKRLYEDNERGDFEHEMSDDRRIPEITTEELQNAISRLKAHPQTAMEFVPKTSKLATTRRER